MRQLAKLLSTALSTAGQWLCAIAAVWLGLTATAWAQYGFDHWTTEHGLPQNSGLAMTQTPDGYLWAATVEGAARFDGVRFTVFDSHNTPAIKHNHILSLLEDRQGNLWLGTNGGGVSMYRDGRFSHYGISDGLSDG